MRKRFLAMGLALCLTLGGFSRFDSTVSAEDAAVNTGQGTEQAAEPQPDQNQGTQAVSDSQSASSQGTEQSSKPKSDKEQGKEQDSESQQGSNQGAAKADQQPAKDGVTPVQIQCVDENGKITYITDDVSPVVNSIDYRSNDIEDYVVNLRARKDGTEVTGTTNYKDAGTGEDGYLSGTSGTDAAYLGTENGQVKFMISGVIGLVDENEVQVVKRSSAKDISSYYADENYLVHKICTNMNTPSTSSIRVGPKPSNLTAGTKYYSYDGHYFYKDYSVMLSDYRNGTRNQSVNPGTPYYNYYQYLPLRSKTVYTSVQLNSKINANTDETSKMWNLGKSLISNQNEFGVNALLMAGIAANESAWGKSSIAQQKNNLFGLGAADDSPGASADSFTSPEACVQNFADGWMSKRYLNPDNWVYTGGFLGNKASGLNVRYASDPYWGEKAASIAWSLDAEGADRYRYAIGIKDTINTKHTNLNVRQESNTSSKSIFTTGLQSDHAFILLSDVNGFYKVQSDPVLNSSRSAIDKSTGKYNASSMYAYASKDYITLVSGKVGSGGSDTPDPSPDPSPGPSPDPSPEPGAQADTLAVRRGNTYYFKYSLSNGPADLTVSYGKATDEVLVGDWDGDGVDTLCVRRGNTYYFKNSLADGEADTVVKYGKKDDVVLAGDWNGDGVDTLCVRRGNKYYIKNSLSNGEADSVVPYGKADDTVLVGDWNKDGKDTFCVRRGNKYFFKNDLSAGEADSVIPYGKANDNVLVGDWNGDGKDTLCVRRGNAYYIKNSINSGEADKVVLYGKADDTTYAGLWTK